MAYKFTPKDFNHQRAIQVSITMPATITTFEAFSTPVGLSFHRMDVQAFVAGLRSVGRRDGENSHPITHSLVGESGVNQTALAALTGVSRQAIIRLEETLVTKAPSRYLEPFVGKRFTLVTSDEEQITIDGIPAGNIKIYTAGFTAAVIRHYDRLGNDVAQYSADQFMEMGINSWIQSITSQLVRSTKWSDTFLIAQGH